MLSLTLYLYYAKNSYSDVYHKIQVLLRYHLKYGWMWVLIEGKYDILNVDIKLFEQHEFFFLYTELTIGFHLPIQYQIYMKAMSIKEFNTSIAEKISAILCTLPDN